MRCQEASQRWRPQIKRAAPGTQLLDAESMLVTHRVRMSAYDAETARARLLAPNHRRTEDNGRALLRQACRDSGTVGVSDDHLDVRLYHLGAPPHSHPGGPLRPAQPDRDPLSQHRSGAPLFGQPAARSFLISGPTSGVPGTAQAGSHLPGPLAQSPGLGQSQRSGPPPGQTPRQGRPPGPRPHPQVDHHPGQDPPPLPLEDLGVKGMLGNHKLAGAMDDSGFSKFRRKLRYKCTWYRSILVAADPSVPSSKRCSDCGMLKAELSPKEHIHRCENCGLALDHDLDAAINLASRADHRAVASSAGRRKTAMEPPRRPGRAGQVAVMRQPASPRSSPHRSAILTHRRRHLAPCPLPRNGCLEPVSEEMSVGCWGCRPWMVGSPPGPSSPRPLPMMGSCCG